jgi:hypothetical protein
VRHRRPQGHQKKLQPPPLGKRRWVRATTKETSLPGNWTVIVFMSERTSPAARSLDALTQGKSSIAVRMQAKISAGKG